MSREFTLIVWGAYSTVGQRVCYELITTYRDKVRFALAGCKRKALERIRKNLALFDKKYEKLPLLVTNIRKKAEVAKMVKRAVVVIGCATPYREYCDIVVECCVEQRTNYYDTTEDVFWVKDVIERFHRKAEMNRVKIVPCCGVASLPVDAALLHMVMKIRRQYRRGISRAVAFYTPPYNSRGETKSLRAQKYLKLLKEGPGRPRDWNDPYLLNPGHMRPQTKVYNLRRLEYDFDFAFWRVPLALEPIGPRVVRRSVAMRKGAYGQDFEYRECQYAKSYLDEINGFKVRLLPPLLVHQLEFVGFARLFRLFPREKDYPKAWEVDSCPWELVLCVMVAPLDPRYPGIPTIKKGYIRDHNFGPYTSSAKLVLACVMCDVMDRQEMKNSGLPHGGVLTATVAFGKHLLKRLTGIGIMPQMMEDFIEPKPKKRPPPPPPPPKEE